MKISLQKEKLLDLTPQEIAPVDFFKRFFELLSLDYPITGNEIKVLSYMCANKPITETGIKKNNMYPVLESLKNKGFLDQDLSLSPTLESYKAKFIDGVEIVYNFKIKKDDTG